MCLIAFALRVDARWPCVIAANRDEAYDRPTLALHAWTSEAGVPVVGGRDARDGGAWMAQSPEGRMAFLTNVRQGLPETGERSRGQLPVGWLAGLSLSAWQAAHPARAFAGCNVVLGENAQGPWWWLTNRDSHGQVLDDWAVQSLAPGIYGLSNAALNTPWPKTVQLTQALRHALGQTEIGADNGPDETRAAWNEPLFAALADATRFADDRLPHTGVPLDAERALSSVFVHWPEHGYGTRSSTVVVVKGDGTSQWVERRWDAHAQRIGETRWDVAGTLPPV